MRRVADRHGSLLVPGIGQQQPFERAMIRPRLQGACARWAATRVVAVLLTRWADTLVPNGATTLYPPHTANYHGKAELVIAI